MGSADLVAAASRRGWGQKSIDRSWAVLLRKFCEKFFVKNFRKFNENVWLSQLHSAAIAPYC